MPCLLAAIKVALGMTDNPRFAWTRLLFTRTFIRNHGEAIHASLRQIRHRIAAARMIVSLCHNAILFLLMANSAHTLPFRHDIQGLGAIAIALVVLAHARVPRFAGGFVGVDVFFVLSGYLIAGLLVRERLSTGEIRYGQFLSQRLRQECEEAAATVAATHGTAK